MDPRLGFTTVVFQFVSIVHSQTAFFVRRSSKTEVRVSCIGEKKPRTADRRGKQARGIADQFG